GDGWRMIGVPKKPEPRRRAAGRISGGPPRPLDWPVGPTPRRAGTEGLSQPAHGASVPPMSEVSRILSAIEQGDPHAAGQLLPLVYDELRQLAAHRLAHETPGQTLQPTALVHEAYLRLVASP